MEPLRFALLEAAHDSPHTTRNFRREVDADLVEFDVNSCDLPPTTEGFDAIIVTGSRASVYWDETWIDPLVEFVATAAEEGVPTLGVCYGHQVLAEALGGRVAGMDEFELGYNEIQQVNDDLLFEGIDETFTAFTTHGDHVVDLPPGSTLLAKNEYAIHSFRVGDAWGVQFHPEYDMKTAREITESKRDRVGNERVESVLDEITPANYEAACQTKQLFENFTQYVRETAANKRVEATA